MFKLVIQDDEGKTTVVPLVRDEVTIGRKEGNTIRLTERNVSRQHARIRRANGAVTIEDLDSYNGVRVNGDRVDGEIKLGETDRVQIGDYLLELHAESEEAEGPDSEQATERIEKVDPTAKTPLPERDAQPTTTPIAKSELAAAEAKAPDPQEAETERIPQIRPSDAAAGDGDAADPGTSADDDAEPADHGRLVVLSTHYAGKDVLLDKPALVIGRTEENDVSIDHRSISRHHAKVVRESGHYAIVDLQSSNGVRVNGEEYGKVELRRGDVIDLGHVRMRYVEPGEDFVFGRDAQAVDLEPRRGRGMVWGALLVLLAGGAAGAFALTRGGGTAPAPSDSTTATSGVDDGPAVAAASPADAAAAPLEDAPSSEDALLRGHIEKASDAIADDRWEDARAAAREALTLDPDSERALELESQAERELENQERFDAFKKAVQAGDYRAVAEQFAQIDNESVYKVKAQPEHERMRGEYIAIVKRRARLAARRGECQTMRRIAADARALWPEAGRAASGFQCRPRVASTDDTSGTGDSGKGDSSDTGGAGKSDSGQNDTNSSGSGSSGGGGGGARPVSEVIKEAQSAAKDDQFGRALRLCEDALRRERGNSEALLVCIISSCSLKSTSKAKRYMSQLTGDRKIWARQICLRKGVDVE